MRLTADAKARNARVLDGSEAMRAMNGTPESQEMMKKVEQVLEWIDEADAVVIGGASGISTANGFDYYNHHTPFFNKYFADFGKIYHEPSCWQLLYHHYNSDEERWAYMARNGCVMLDLPAGQTYLDLHALVGDKDYYVITTNQDAQFAKVFDPERIFTIQGDAHWMQCSRRCHDKIYRSEETLHKLNASIVHGKIPTEMVPRCPVCGEVMEPWVKSFIFHYSSYWDEQADKYKAYLKEHINQKVLFFALGVGNMTPEFIKHPFINMTYNWPNARLVLLNIGEPDPMKEIADKTVAMNADILETLKTMAEMKTGTTRRGTRSNEQVYRNCEEN